MSLDHALVLSNCRLPPLSRLLITGAMTVAKWELRHRTRKSLGHLTPHLRADIGMDAHTAEVEAAKRFWRA